MSCSPAARGPSLGPWRNPLHPSALPGAAGPPGARTSEESHLDFTASPAETAQGQASRAGGCSHPLPGGTAVRSGGAWRGSPAPGCQDPKSTGPNPAWRGSLSQEMLNLPATVGACEQGAGRGAFFPPSYHVCGLLPSRGVRCLICEEQRWLLQTSGPRFKLGCLVPALPKTPTLAWDAGA